MIHTTAKIRPLYTAIDTYFETFKTEILNYSSKQWSEEELKGKSYYQWKVDQYYKLMYLLIIVYNEIDRTRSLNYPWSYYSSKFGLEAIQKCVACEGISFSKAYTAFGFDAMIAAESGIESMGIENNFQIYDGEGAASEVSIKEVLEVGSICVNNIADNIVAQEGAPVTNSPYTGITDTITDNDGVLIDTE